MTNKKKRKSRQIPDLPPGPLKSGIAKRTARRQLQKAILLKFKPLSEAFDEVLAQLQFLSNSDDLRPEVSYLLDEAQRWVIGGVDHALAEDTSNEIDEARKLLELEYLLLDFAAVPSSLDEWTAIESWKRQTRFGFGELRKREERRQELDEDMVIAARDYWITHSIHSHPKPPHDEPPQSPDQSRSLLLLLCDLLGHAMSVVHAAKECIESQGIKIPSNFTKLSTAAIETSWSKMHEVLHSHIPEDLLEATRNPHPRKQLFPYPIQSLDTDSNLKDN